MEIKVYVDVLFFINFIFDYLLLWMTGLICKSSAKFFRLIVSSLSGALYATLMFFLPVNFLYTLPAKLLVGALMTAITFRPRTFRIFVQYACTFFLVSTFLAGASFAVFYFSDTAALDMVIRNGSLYINIPTYQLLLTALACVPITRVAFACGRHILQNNKENICLGILYHGKVLNLSAFYDSGNFLCDPISQKGVIIASWNKAKHLFPGYERPEEVKGLTPLPFHTLTEDGVLYAFWPDAIYIQKKHTQTQIETVYIGLLDRTFDQYQNRDAILPRDFKGENHYETAFTSKTADLV